MIRSSVFYTISFFFFLSTVSIFLAYLWLMEYDKQNYTKELNTKYSIVSKATLFHLNNFITQNELEEQMKDYQMIQIENSNMKEYIIKNAQTLEEIKAKIGTSSILKYKKYHYLKIVHNNNTLLLKDEDFQPYRYDVIKLIFAGIFIILLASYIFTIRKLKPLRQLKVEIDKFAKGDLEEVTCKAQGNDEISEVAQAFGNAVLQIRSLNSSRQLFLRNVMHELKTPITKGLITTEMIPPSKHQERLVGVFEKLETLINEFASIEQVTSGFGIANVKPYRFVDLLDEAIDISMIERECIEVNIAQEMHLMVDFKLFSIALKNMIDNGVKYSTDNCIKIIANLQSINFISRGNPLSQELSHYLEPFTQDSNHAKSFGLGLYIVDNIIRGHKLTLEYNHKNGFNTFSFKGLKILQETLYNKP